MFSLRTIATRSFKKAATALEKAQKNHKKLIKNVINTVIVPFRRIAVGKRIYKHRTGNLSRNWNTTLATEQFLRAEALPMQEYAQYVAKWERKKTGSSWIEKGAVESDKNLDNLMKDNVIKKTIKTAVE